MVDPFASGPDVKAVDGARVDGVVANCFTSDELKRAPPLHGNHLCTARASLCLRTTQYTQAKVVLTLGGIDAKLASGNRPIFSLEAVDEGECLVVGHQR
jgi:hypothetical protein